MMNCDHMPRLQAHFIDPVKRRAVIKLMPKLQALREMFNIIPKVHGQLWTTDYLQDKLFGQVAVDIAFNNFMFVDPSMTSTNGSMTGTSIVSVNKKDIVTKYINASITDSNTAIVDFIVKDIEYFFSVFPESRIFLFVESNTVNHGREIQEALKKRKWIKKGKVIHIKGIQPKYRKFKNDIRQNREFERFGVQKRGGHEEKFLFTKSVVQEAGLESRK